MTHGDQRGLPEILEVEQRNDIIFIFGPPLWPLEGS